jgi:hypothetical protein
MESGKERVAEVESEAHFWLRATVDDIKGIDFERPIAEANSADCRQLSAAYRDAAKAHRELDEAAAPASRVFAMLGAATDFHFKANNSNAPYGPTMIMDGRRSPIPEDFRGDPVLVLAYAAERAENPVLSARLCDVCWLLERKRHGLGRAAVASYVEIVKGLGSGRLTDRLERDDPTLGLTARDALRRALTYGPCCWLGKR